VIGDLTERPEDLGGEAPPSDGRSFYASPALRLWSFAMLGSVLVFGLQGLYPTFIGPISNVLPTLGAATAFASALLCWRRYGYGLRKKFEAVWFFFSLGTGLWILAELTWAAYYFFLNVEVPYPSAADFFYVGGYIPVLVGLAIYLKAFWGSMSPRRLALAAMTIAAATALALGLVLPMELSQGPSAADLLTALAYPVLDLALFSSSVLALAIFAGGRLSRWWVLFGGASLLYVLGDEYFLYLNSAGTYYNGSFDDLLFILGYLTFALAFYAHRREF
jgi:hypothetical protein